MNRVRNIALTCVVAATVFGLPAAVVAEPTDRQRLEKLEQRFHDIEAQVAQLQALMLQHSTHSAAQMGHGSSSGTPMGGSGTPPNLGGSQNSPAPMAPAQNPPTSMGGGMQGGGMSDM